MRRIAIGLCLLVVALLGAGCAGPGARPGSIPSTSATWGNFALQVAGVASGPGPRAVTITVRPPTGCWRNLAVTNDTEENGNIFANVVAVPAEGVLRRRPDHAHDHLGAARAVLRRPTRRLTGR